MFFASAIKRKFTKQSPRAGFVSVDYPLCPLSNYNSEYSKDKKAIFTSFGSSLFRELVMKPFFIFNSGK